MHVLRVMHHDRLSVRECTRIGEELQLTTMMVLVFEVPWTVKVTLGRMASAHRLGFRG